MTPGEWAAVAGFLFTVGGAVWGHGLGRGRNRTQLKAMAGTLLECSQKLEVVQKNFIECQRNSTDFRARAGVHTQETEREVQQLRITMAANAAQLLAHATDRGVHTDQEWRSTMISRLEAIAAGISTRLASFEGSISGRIGALEKAFKNGTGGSES